MPFNGAGVFTRVYNWVTDRNNGIKILASRMDQEMDGFASGLSNTITRDGQSTVTQDIPFNNCKITQLGNATADADALNRITGDGRYAQRANNLSDLTDAAAARTAIGAENASNLSTGTIADARLPTTQSSKTFTGAVTSTSAVPLFNLHETGGASTHNRTQLLQFGNVFEYRTASNAGTLVAVDYTSLKGASGAINHVFRVEGVEKGRFDGTGLSLADDLAIAHGGTGASTASGARANLGLAIGTDVQAYDADLQAIAGLTSAADRLPYYTGSGSAALATFTSFARSLVDDVNAAAARSTLGATGITNGTQVVASGVAVNFSGIPAGTKRVTIMVAALSTNGTSGLALLLGDSGGLETTGYGGSCAVVANGAATVAVNSATQFVVTPSGTSAAAALNGSITLTLLEPSVHTWAVSGVIGYSGTGSVAIIGGQKSLSSALTQLRLISANGTDTFDQGVFNISYE